MITFEKQENGVLFTFENSDKYLYGDGTILVPFNSLAVIQDESDMITLRKSASWDIFLSGRFDTDFNYGSKEDAVDALKEALFDETGGVTEEEVEQMIDAATSGIPSSQVIEQLRNDVNAVSGEVDTLQDDVAGINNTLTAHTANTNIHVTSTDKSNWDAKQDALTAGENITISGNVISAEAGNNIIELTQEEYDALVDKDPDVLYIITDASEINMNDYWTSAETKSYVDGKVDDALDDYWTSAETQNAINAATSGIPSSQVIEQLRTDVNTISGDVQSLQDDVNSVWDTIDEKEEVVASALTELNLRVTEDEEVTAAALNDLQENKADTSAVTQSLSAKQDALVHYTEDTENKTATIDVQTDDGLNKSENRVFVDGGDIIIESYNETDDGEGNAGTTDTQVDINSLGLSIITYSDDGIDTNQTELKVQPMGAYINSEQIATEPYVNAALSGKVDTSAITTSITSGSTDSEIPTAKAVYDAIPTGGGATYSAGQGISIDTANKISFAVPIYSGATGNVFNPTYNNNSILIGNSNNQASNTSVAGGNACTTQNFSFAYGGNNTATGATSVAFGNRLNAINDREAAFGSYNVSNKANTTFGDSGNTLFSVGNGTSSARHNALEIRQNGDIYITSGNTDIKLQDHLGGGGGSVTVDPTLDTGSTNPVANSAITQALENKLDASAYTPTDLSEYWTSAQTQSAIDGVNNALTAHTANTTVHVTSVEKDAWNAKANIDHVNQSEYDAMVTAGTLDSNTMYIIDDAVPFDPSTKVDVSAITTSMTSSSTDAQVPSAKATYDAITAATTGGGATYSAGTNISIDTGNTISCTLPITANTGNKNVTVGYDLKVREEGETSIGKYNVNRYRNAATHSENTIFTVGNGGSNGLRHNALEIRKNGDLYFADTSNGGQSYYEKPMVRLQDMYAALGGLKFVKLTQSQYDQLATKDSSTLYIISD